MEYDRPGSAIEALAATFGEIEQAISELTEAQREKLHEGNSLMQTKLESLSPFERQMPEVEETIFIEVCSEVEGYAEVNEILTAKEDEIILARRNSF